MRHLAFAVTLLAIAASPAAAQSGLSFSWSPSTVHSSVPVTFTDTSTASGIVANLWNIDGTWVGGGCGCRTVNVVRTFATPGPKVVQLSLIFGNGSSQSVFQTVNVLQGPLAVVSSSATTGCAPLTVTLNGSASSSPFGPVTHQWTFSDGGSAAGVSVVRAFTGASAWADLTITDPSGYTNTRRINISAWSSTANYGPLGSTNICWGDPAQIAVTLTGDPPFQVQWADGYSQYVVAPGTFTRLRYWLTPGPHAASISGVTDGHGCAATVSGSANFVVFPQPQAAVSAVGDTDLSYGEAGTIGVSLAGTPPFTLTWSDGVVQTTSQLTATRLVAPASATTYTLTGLSDAAGCSNALIGPAAVAFTVRAGPPLDGHAYTIDGANILRRVRLSNGTTESSLPVTLGGQAALPVRALVRRPGTTEHYALLGGLPGISFVASLDVSTGIATPISASPTGYRSLAFDGLGRLIVFGTSLFGTNTPFYAIHLATGAATAVSPTPVPSATMKLAYVPNSGRFLALDGGTAASAKTVREFGGAAMAQTSNLPLASRPGELSGAFETVSYANGYNLLATIGNELYVVFGETRVAIRTGTWNHVPAALACDRDAFVGLSGSGDDLVLEAGLNGAFGPAGRVAAAPGTALGFRWSSPGAGLAGAPYYFVVDVYAAGQEPVSSIPGLAPSYVGAASVLLLTGNLAGSTPSNYPLQVPPGLAGLVARVQVAAPLLAGPTPQLALSEGAEVEFVP